MKRTDRYKKMWTTEQIKRNEYALECAIATAQRAFDMAKAHLLEEKKRQRKFNRAKVEYFKRNPEQTQ